MFQKLLELSRAYALKLCCGEPDENYPAPVNELDGSTVRLPAWADSRMAWQGVTFSAHGDKIRVQTDTGPCHDADSVEAAFEWYLTNTDCWRWSEPSD